MLTTRSPSRTDEGEDRSCSRSTGVTNMSPDLLLEETISGGMRKGIVEALLEVLERTDNFTLTHSYRVAQLAVPIGAAMHLSEDAIETLRVAALLHDLGKAFIPPQILLSLDFLTEEEFSVMRKHPEYGYEFVQRIGFLREAADIILSHHEKYDGTGYPRGLKGKEISLAARIFALVDTVDALVYDRPYHRGADFPAVREEITKRSGTHFDPDLVAVALDCLADRFPA